jgi:hypothetical protein
MADRIQKTDAPGQPEKAAEVPITGGKADDSAQPA